MPHEMRGELDSAYHTFVIDIGTAEIRRWGELIYWFATVGEVVDASLVYDSGIGAYEVNAVPALPYGFEHGCLRVVGGNIGLEEAGVVVIVDLQGYSLASLSVAAYDGDAVTFGVEVFGKVDAHARL